MSLQPNPWHSHNVVERVFKQLPTKSCKLLKLNIAPSWQRYGEQHSFTYSLSYDNTVHVKDFDGIWIDIVIYLPKDRRYTEISFAKSREALSKWAWTGRTTGFKGMKYNSHSQRTMLKKPHSLLHYERRKAHSYKFSHATCYFKYAKRIFPLDSPETSSNESNVGFLHLFVFASPHLVRTWYNRHDSNYALSSLRSEVYWIDIIW